MDILITKKSPLSTLRHHRVVNSEFLKQRFDGCLFQVSFYLYYFFIIYNLFYQSLYILHFTISARSVYIYIYTFILQKLLLTVVWDA